MRERLGVGLFFGVRAAGAGAEWGGFGGFGGFAQF